MTDYLYFVLKLLDEEAKKGGPITINKLIEAHIIDYDELLSTLLSEGTASKLYSFARYVERVSKADKLTIATKLVERRAILEMFYMARDISDAPILLLEEAIIASRSGHFIYLFAKEVKEANIELLENAIIDLADSKSIFRFAVNVPGANLEKLTSAIIKTHDAKYICLFATSIPGVNLPLLEEELVRTGDITEYQKFLAYKKKVQDEDYLKLSDAIAGQNMDDLEKNRERYSYLFRESSSEAKALIKKINDSGY